MTSGGGSFKIEATSPIRFSSRSRFRITLFVSTFKIKRTLVQRETRRIKEEEIIARVRLRGTDFR